MRHEDLFTPLLPSDDLPFAFDLPLAVDHAAPGQPADAGSAGRAAAIGLQRPVADASPDGIPAPVAGTEDPTVDSLPRSEPPPADPAEGGWISAFIPAIAEAPAPSAVSPTGWSVTSAVANSGTTSIDALNSGVKWGAGGAGTAVTVSYSFPAGGAVWGVNYGSGEPVFGYAPLTAEQQNAARIALQRWDEVAAITFVEVPDTARNVGDIRFANSGVPFTAWAYYPGPFAEAGDVWFGPNFDYGSARPGTYSLLTFIHEIGHAIGLKHPHESGGSAVALSTAVDYLGHTVMSYRSYVGQDVSAGYSNSFYPTTPGIFDIAALQYLYGTDTTTRAGDTVYRWTPGAQLFETIWDAGGIDTIDWSNQTSPAVINLTSGVWSRLGPAYSTAAGADDRTLKIAFGAIIENAVGGAGNDRISSGPDDDTVAGGDGNDKVNLGPGVDTVDGGEGRDFLQGLDGADVIHGGPGDDRGPEPADP
ncbi:MAG TPA: M10 family metallopeptidase C-terminal domain-containing protein, partial [Rhodospirillales bacterium]|nr:M10 family metallopeptidase C-terminal domain-containing protein [Rhodospirillales bacterium]